MFVTFDPKGVVSYVTLSYAGDSPCSVLLSSSLGSGNRVWFFPYLYRLRSAGLFEASDHRAPGLYKNGPGPAQGDKVLL